MEGRRDARPGSARPRAYRPEISPTTLLLHGALLFGTFSTLTLWSATNSFTMLPSVLGLLDGVPYALCVLAILGAHEMGHYLACRRYGIPATLPFFLPGPAFGTFGALIRIRGVIPSRKALFDVAAAGPIAGFLVALPILGVGIARARPSPIPLDELPPGMLLFGDPLVARLGFEVALGSTAVMVDDIYFAAWFGLLITAMNLFPVGQLDGGHVAFALSRRFHRVTSWVATSALVAFVAYRLVMFREPSVYTLWCIVLLFLRAKHPPVYDPVGEIGTGRRVVAVCLAALFVLCFTPVPIVIT